MTIINIDRDITDLLCLMLFFMWCILYFSCHGIPPILQDCTAQQTVTANKPGYCGMINDKTIFPFKDDAQRSIFFDSCKEDYCNSDEPDKSVCTILEAVAENAKDANPNFDVNAWIGHAKVDCSK